METAPWPSILFAEHLKHYRCARAVPLRGVYRGCRSSRCRAGSWQRSLLSGGRRRAARRSTLALWGATGKRNVRGRRAAEATGGARSTWSTRIGGSGGGRRRPATGRARSTGHKRAMIGRISREARPSPGARPARGQAHTRPLTPPVAVWGGRVRRGGGVGRGGGIARRGPAVGLAGARRRGAPVRPGGQPGIDPENDPFI